MKQIKFYADHIERILSREKYTTVRADSKNMFRGDVVQLVDMVGNLISTAIISRVLSTVHIQEDGLGDFGGSYERTDRILKSEDMNWDDFVGFIKRVYGLPFTGCVIEWELVSNGNT